MAKRAGRSSKKVIIGKHRNEVRLSTTTGLIESLEKECACLAPTRYYAFRFRLPLEQAESYGDHCQGSL